MKKNPLTMALKIVMTITIKHPERKCSRKAYGKKYALLIATNLISICCIYNEKNG